MSSTFRHTSERGIELDFVVAEFCVSNDVMGDPQDCGVCAQFIEPVGLQFEAVYVVDWASIRRDSPRQVSGDYLVDCVASEPRDVGDNVLGALEELDFDRVLHSRRNLLADPRATFRLFKKSHERVLGSVRRIIGRPRKYTRKC